MSFRMGTQFPSGSVSGARPFLDAGGSGGSVRRVPSSEFRTAPMAAPMTGSFNTVPALSAYPDWGTTNSLIPRSGSLNISTMPPATAFAAPQTVMSQPLNNQVMMGQPMMSQPMSGSLRSLPHRSAWAIPSTIASQQPVSSMVGPPRVSQTAYPTISASTLGPSRENYEDPPSSRRSISDRNRNRSAYEDARADGLEGSRVFSHQGSIPIPLDRSSPKKSTYGLGIFYKDRVDKHGNSKHYHDDCDDDPFASDDDEEHARFEHLQHQQHAAADRQAEEVQGEVDANTKAVSKPKTKWRSGRSVPGTSTSDYPIKHPQAEASHNQEVAVKRVVNHQLTGGMGNRQNHTIECKIEEDKPWPFWVGAGSPMARLEPMWIDGAWYLAAPVDFKGLDRLPKALARQELNAVDDALRTLDAEGRIPPLPPPHHWKENKNCPIA